MSTVKLYTESELGSPSIKEILRYAKAKESNDLVAHVENAANELSGKLTPRVCYAQTPIKITGSLVDLGFCKVESKDLAKNLEGCESAIVFAATVGMSVDVLCVKYARISPFRALLIQATGTERIEALCDLFEKEIKEELKTNGKTTRPRFSPGYGDLPLLLQKDIFPFLSPEKIGIRLGESLLMTPTKSVTAIIGIKDEIK